MRRKENTMLALCVLTPCLLWSGAHGKGYSLPYSPENERICRDSETEYYKEDLKLCCSRCAPGSHMEKECSTASDTQCKPCREGRYTSIWNYFPQCFRCPGACREEDGMVESRPCSLSNPRLCDCVEGMYCVMRATIHSCEVCQNRTWCEPGFGASRPESADLDTVCSPCEPGSFSSQPSSAPCQWHTDCSAQGRSVLSQGTSSSDAVCGGAVEWNLVPVTPPGGGSTEPPHTPRPSLGRETSSTAFVGELRSRSEGEGRELGLVYGIAGGIAGFLLIIGVLAAKCVQMRRAGYRVPPRQAPARLLLRPRPQPPRTGRAVPSGRRGLQQPLPHFLFLLQWGGQSEPRGGVYGGGPGVVLLGQCRGIRRSDRPRDPRQRQHPGCDQLSPPAPFSPRAQGLHAPPGGGTPVPGGERHQPAPLPAGDGQGRPHGGAGAWRGQCTLRAVIHRQASRGRPSTHTKYHCSPPCPEQTGFCGSLSCCVPAHVIVIVMCLYWEQSLSWCSDVGFTAGTHTHTHTGTFIS